MLRYYHTKLGKECVSIDSGEYFVTEEDLVIHSVLGSCVSVCLRDYKGRIAGMNHFILPTGDSTGMEKSDEQGRFGDKAIQLMLDEMEKKGISARELEAKVFGGASMLVPGENSSNPPGQQNIEFAIKYLERANIPIASSSLGGKSARRLYYFTKSGLVRVEKISLG